MPRQVSASVFCQGSELAPADLLHVALKQTIFGHHSFELTVPFDRMEGLTGGFLSQAHKRLLGKPLTLEMVADQFHFNSGQHLNFKGLVARLGTGRENDYTGTFSIYAYSPCYLLASGLKKRTFVKQTLSSIFQQILEPFPSDLLPRTISPAKDAMVPYVVQYQETNYEFLSRLAAEYGEWFYYDGSTLQLGPPPSGDALKFVADGSYNGFTFGLGVKPVSATLYEYNYEQHEHFTSPSKGQAVPSIEDHQYGGFALQTSQALFPDASHVAAETQIQGLGQLADEARGYKAIAAADLVTVDGYSDNPALRLGGIIRIVGPGLGSRTQLPEDFGVYRILELTHYLDSKYNYSNRFAAVPHQQEVAPINPFYDAPAGQPELAEVIDTKDPQHLGRVRVRYYWPVAQPQQAETDWLRVLTPYSGAGKGQLFTPEKGSQVLVGYQNGLAEQPYVQGNLFHAKNPAKAKYSHGPGGAEVKGIQTMAGNRITFLEKKGEEKILITNGNKKETILEISFKGKGQIELKTAGDISLSAGHNVRIKAGKKMQLKADELTLEAKTIKAKADSTVEMAAASAQLKMAGSSTQVKGTLTQG